MNKVQVKVGRNKLASLNKFRWGKYQRLSNNKKRREENSWRKNR